MYGRVFQIIFMPLGVSVLVSCSHLRVESEVNHPITTLSPPEIDSRRPSESGCLSLMSHYCDSLYSPGSEGNLIIKQQKGNPIYILQGKTRNGLHHVFYELSRSKIRNRERLPRDFLSILKAHQYFERLDDLIHREPFEKMSLMDRIEANETERLVEHIWNLAISDTLIIRLSNRFPDFPTIPASLLPPEMAHHSVMERKILLSEISKAIWRDHPNWRKVTHTFERLRKTYIQLIPTLPIPQDMKTDWMERIRSLNLVLPGSFPEIVDQDCSSTTMNAFYYPNMNVLTVCAGDFNSEDILITLAHEMAHALDHGRSLHLFYQNSPLSKKLEEFNHAICDPKKRSLPCQEWIDFKSRSGDFLGSISGYKPPLQEFNRCLKKESTTRPLNEESILRFAASSTREKIRELAEEEAFIRIIRPDLPLANGKRVRNPSHLNACHYLQTHWKNEDLSSELSILTVFTMDYQCSPVLDPSERLKSSLDFTGELFEAIEKELIRNEGEFSERKELVDEGFSSPSSERFADSIGSLVIAEFLQEIHSTWDRRMTFLAGNSWQCDGPSLSKELPKETQVLRRYLLDTHTEGENRKKDMLSAPVRRSLGCVKDFEWNECSLLRNPGKP
ncbi:MAG: hypothetical protein KGP28_10420 [Bdellovibrionales bacterium]|nr:hypothetical protein [Bdellovibrionales bacterium]